MGAKGAALRTAWRAAPEDKGELRAVCAKRCKIVCKMVQPVPSHLLHWRTVGSWFIFEFFFGKKLRKVSKWLQSGGEIKEKIKRELCLFATLQRKTYGLACAIACF